MIINCSDPVIETIEVSDDDDSVVINDRNDNDVENDVEYGEPSTKHVEPSDSNHQASTSKQCKQSENFEFFITHVLHQSYVRL